MKARDETRRCLRQGAPFYLSVYLHHSQLDEAAIFETAGKVYTASLAVSADDDGDDDGGDNDALGAQYKKCSEGT